RRARSSASKRAAPSTQSTLLWGGEPPGVRAEVTSRNGLRPAGTPQGYQPRRTLPSMSDRTDLSPVLDAMDATWDSIIDLAESLTVHEWSLPTRCPGWDVHDQIAHVASL